MTLTEDFAFAAHMNDHEKIAKLEQRNKDRQDG
jgi:hypothetical protein